MSVVEENLNRKSSAFLPSMRGFKLASLNIASLPKHIDELRVLLSDKPLDILSINETRLDDSVSDNEVYIPGYDIIRRDREHNGRFGGGVCIYVRSNINFSLRPDLSDISSMIKGVLSQPNFSPQTNTTQLFPQINTNFNNLSSVKVNTNISSCVKLDEWDKFEFSVKKEGKF